MALLLYHLFTCIAYFSPLLGSLMADSYLGRFKVIFYVSIFYVIGHILLSFGSIHNLPTFLRFGLDYTGLFVIAVCTGGIKPCVSAFAADQFEESQKNERSQFFSFFYFAINAKNIAFNVVKCIGSALRNKYFQDSKEKRQDWLEYAMPEYTQEMVTSVRSFIDVAIIFMPLILFWALFDQQASTWVIQAQNMNCRVGHLTIMAEQMSFINPLLIIILVPVFEMLIFPCLKKCLNVTPLRKMAIGGVLASLAFVVAGFVQLGVNGTLPIIPAERQICLWTLPDTTAALNSSATPLLLKGESRLVEAESYIIGGHPIQLHDYAGKGVVVIKCNFRPLILPFTVHKPQRTMVIYLMVENSNSLYNGTITATNSRDEVICGVTLATSNASDGNSFFNLKLPILSDGLIYLKYGMKCEEKCEHERIEFGMGSVYVAHLNGSVMVFTNLVESNGMSLLWTIPQYLLLTMGEILISVTGLEFAYSQSSADMKSVLQIRIVINMQALWLMTVFLGNLIDAMISGSHFVTRPAHEFFFYAFLMLIVMIIFIFLGEKCPLK
ncbi:hypothetical protein PFISCL1PPCAC_19999, partial [Pristionchus fissidentatus]